MKRPLPRSLAVFLVVFTPLTCSAQFYDFSEGNDSGWQRLDPLTEAGIPAGTFSFPDGGYRLTHPASPSPEELGNARIGSFRPDVVQNGDFYISVDVTAWDDVEDQNIGLLAMITDPGLGKTSGYALTLDVSEQNLYLSIIDFESPSILTFTPLEELADPEIGFRLVFERTDGEFLGNIFALTDLETTLATVEGFDDIFEQGSPGLFASVDPADGAIDVTFDNFSLSPDGENSDNGPLRILQSDLANESLSVRFAPLQPNAEYALEGSTDLVTWGEVTDSFESDPAAKSGVFEVPVTGDHQYFRVSPVQ